MAGNESERTFLIMFSARYLVKVSNERDMEELLLGSIFYCFQIGGKSRTTGSDQMAPIYTRPT